MDPFTPYLAGFFDGDGSIHFQIVRSNVYRYGFYIRSSLVFYQSTSAEAGLLEIRERTRWAFAKKRHHVRRDNHE